MTNDKRSPSSLRDVHRRAVERAAADTAVQVEDIANSKFFMTCTHPDHADETPSMAVEVKKGNVLVHCQAKTDCDQGEVWHGFQQFMGWNSNHAEPKSRKDVGGLVATYTYEDEQGKPLFDVLRYEKYDSNGERESKTFRQHPPGRRSGRIAGVRRVLYRLPRVLEAIEAGERIFLVEGEKDVHEIESAGGTATTVPSGAGKESTASLDLLRSFSGGEVSIVADADDTGLTHGRRQRFLLLGIAAQTRLLQAAVGKDAAEHLAAGFTLDDFVPVPRTLERELLGVYEPTEVTWLYEPLLPRGVHVLITGRSGAGKTYVTACVVADLIKRGMHVAYLDQENGPDLIKERLALLGVSDEDLDTYFHYSPYPREATLDNREAWIGEVMEDDPALIVFDSKLNFLAMSDLDEDKSRDLIDWHIDVVQVYTRLGVTVVELDHSGHDSKGRPRGTSAKEQVAEYSWAVALKGDKTFTPDSTSVMTFKQGYKNRRGVLPETVAYTIGGNGNGEFIFRPTDVPDDTGEEATKWTTLRKATDALLEREGAIDSKTALGADRVGKLLRTEDHAFDQTEFREHIKAWAEGASSKITKTGKGYYLKVKEPKDDE